MDKSYPKSLNKRTLFDRIKSTLRTLFVTLYLRSTAMEVYQSALDEQKVVRTQWTIRKWHGLIKTNKNDKNMVLVS